MKQEFANRSFRQQTGVVLRHVAGEIMLVPAVTREVDMDSLFLLNRAGAWLWEELGEMTGVAVLAEKMAAYFGIEQERAEADVAAFLSQLQDRNLVVAE